eukprot:167842_1
MDVQVRVVEKDINDKYNNNNYGAHTAPPPHIPSSNIPQADHHQQHVKPTQHIPFDDDERECKQENDGHWSGCGGDPAQYRNGPWNKGVSGPPEFRGIWLTGKEIKERGGKIKNWERSKLYRYGAGIVEDKNLIIQIYNWQLGNSIYNVKTGLMELTPGQGYGRRMLYKGAGKG